MLESKCVRERERESKSSFSFLKVGTVDWSIYGIRQQFGVRETPSKISTENEKKLVVKDFFLFKTISLRRRRNVSLVFLIFSARVDFFGQIIRVPV